MIKSPVSAWGEYRPEFAGVVIRRNEHRRRHPVCAEICLDAKGQGGYFVEFHRRKSFLTLWAAFSTTMARVLEIVATSSPSVSQSTKQST